MPRAASNTSPWCTNLDAKRLLFAPPGRDHTSVQRFAQDLTEHGAKPEQIEHACMDMSAAYALGVAESLPKAQISHDRFHVVALAGEAMDEVRSAEWKQQAAQVQAAALGPLDTRERRSLLWAPSGWSAAQTRAMHWLQRANLKSARVWRLKMGMRQVCAQARLHGDGATARADLKRWIGWARRSRLDAFKRLAATLAKHFDVVWCAACSSTAQTPSWRP